MQKPKSIKPFDQSAPAIYYRKLAQHLTFIAIELSIYEIGCYHVMKFLYKYPPKVIFMQLFVHMCILSIELIWAVKGVLGYINTRAKLGKFVLPRQIRTYLDPNWLIEVGQQIFPIWTVRYILTILMTNEEPILFDTDLDRFSHYVLTRFGFLIFDLFMLGFNKVIVTKCIKWEKMKALKVPEENM